MSQQGCQWTPCELWWDAAALTNCQYLQFLGMPRIFSGYESSLWICESLLISFIKYQIEFLSVGIAFIQWEHYQGGWFVSQSLMDILLGNLQKPSWCADIMMFTIMTNKGLLKTELQINVLLLIIIGNYFCDLGLNCLNIRLKFNLFYITVCPHPS